MDDKLVNYCAGANSHTLPAKKTKAILANVPYNGIDDKSIFDAFILQWSFPIITF